MRLISQDGLIDVPYEQVAIELKESEIWCEYSATVQSYCTGRMVAKYTTEAKALKVMEMLREQYMRNNALYIDRENNARVIPQNSLFQFPADEEIEV